MKDYRKVLIAVNGNKDVLVQGLRLVSGEKCQVTVVKVIPHYEGDLSMVGVKNVDALLNSDSEKEFSEIMEIANNKGANVKVRLEEGEICEKIVETAEDEKADLIIMGAKKQNIIEKLFISDDIDKVTSQAPCPILLVKS